MNNSTIPNSATTPNPSKSVRPSRSLWQRFKLRPFVIRWSNWEFYPTWLTNIPHVFIYLFFTIRARAWLWFTATNPAIYTGGMMGESKREIDAIIPKEYNPKTIFIESKTPLATALQQLKEAGLNFPVFAKPDKGGRGTGVRKIKNEAELQAYLEQMPVLFLIQEAVELPVEVAVMYYRFPDNSQKGILSVTLKEFLTITGDGVSTFLELMEDNFRAVLVLDAMKERHAHRLQEIVPEGETIVLESVGNHCRGTKFISGNHLITNEMIESFHHITAQIEGLYFCRYDLRCASLEDLQKGKIKILEINGVGSDPNHIYDPQVGLFEKYRVIYRQWRAMYQIARMNHAKGVPYMSLSEFRAHLRDIKNYNKQHNFK